MKQRSFSNPAGIGFTELMTCSEALFVQVCHEIEAGEWQRARALLELSERAGGAKGSRNSSSGGDKES